MNQPDSSGRVGREGGVPSFASSDSLTADIPRYSLGPLVRARWKLATRTELAEPGLMELVPIRDTQERIVDFEWTEATWMAANLLDRLGEDLAGRRLLEVMPGYQAGRRLFEAYRKVATEAIDVAVIARSLHAKTDSVVVHHVRSSPTGVTVVLTSPSAVARMHAAERALGAMEQRLCQS
jgi:hypothetical protein